VRSEGCGWTRTVCGDVLCECASVSGTAVQLFCIAMCCWEMQSVTDSSYTGTVIVCTSAIAVLNYCVYMTVENYLERYF
jgi:hypothetical protein